MIGIKNFPAALMVSGASVTFNCNATFIRCLTGNNSMKLECYRKSDKVIDFDGFGAGLEVGPIYESSSDALQRGISSRNVIVFDQVILTNGTTAQQIILAFGDGEVQDNRLVGNVNITGGLSVKGPSATVAFGTVAITNVATKVWTGNATGSSDGRIQNNTAVDLFIGPDNTVTTANGILVPAKVGTYGGYVDGLSGAQDLYCIAAAAGPVNLLFWQSKT